MIIKDKYSIIKLPSQPKWLKCREEKNNKTGRANIEGK